MSSNASENGFDPDTKEPAPRGHAVVSMELHDGSNVVRCTAIDLVRGSLRRRGVQVSEVPQIDAQTSSFTVFNSPVHDRSGLSVFAGASPEAWDAVRHSVSEWAAVAAPRRVLLASPRSFCAGVERAIEIVEQALVTRGAPVYVRKQIVHNTYVVEDFANRGAIFVDELDEIPDGATVVFSAHGVSPAVREEAARRRLDVIDGTCPLVAKVHSEAKRFAGRGDTIVLIGHAGHEEVEGTIGEAPEATVLVEKAEDVAELDLPDPGRVSYLTQTTLAVDETSAVVNALRQKYPSLHEPPSDDICYATTNRQNAVNAVIEDSDLVLVIGSANSSNSVRLMELSRRAGTPAHLIDSATDILPIWLEGVRTIGLTAGASAPPLLVSQVVSALRGLGEITLEERSVTEETIHFGLPSAAHRRAD
ncbi:4-hydroxy-3-methylbut-2-enyl diphosphate reductase [Lentzea alba]|uniref:4-hydroxy-3-methylbut-2-enyl diphosphate reductase n=1 Tax=Lentzea alba TaxID=2714351 RepID=UPI0039BFEFCC